MPGKGRTGRPRNVFTTEVLATIPFWVEQGADRGDIATALGTTKASLSATCARHGISLRSANSAIRHRIGTKRWAILRREAERRQMSISQLFTETMIAVVDANLFPAVLGDYDDLEVK